MVLFGMLVDCDCGVLWGGYWMCVDWVFVFFEWFWNVVKYVCFGLRDVGCFWFCWVVSVSGDIEFCRYGWVRIWWCE